MRLSICVYPRDQGERFCPRVLFQVCSVIVPTRPKLSCGGRAGLRCHGLHAVILTVQAGRHYLGVYVICFTSAWTIMAQRGRGLAPVQRLVHPSSLVGIWVRFSLAALPPPRCGLDSRSDFVFLAPPPCGLSYQEVAVGGPQVWPLTPTTTTTTTTCQRQRWPPVCVEQSG